MTLSVPGPPNRRFRVAATWLAHMQPLVIAGAFAIYLIDAVAVPLAIPALVATLAVFVTIAAEVWHVFRLCPRCAANTPLNGPETARRRSDWLRLHHALRPRWPMLILFTAGITLAVFTRVPSAVALAPLYVEWVVEAAASLRHRPLEPWCPQCDWDDDGFEEADPVLPPVPSGEGKR